MENEIDIKLSLDNLSEEEREQFMALVKKANEPKVWKPKFGTAYYSVDFDGKTNFEYWNCDEYDEGAFAIGNCFKTKEEAEFMVEKLKVISELKRFAEEHNTKIDWNDSNQSKYFLLYDYQSSNISVGDNQFMKRAVTYFSSKELALKAIDAIGEDRLKKYYFEIS